MSLIHYDPLSRRLSPKPPAFAVEFYIESNSFLVLFLRPLVPHQNDTDPFGAYENNLVGPFTCAKFIELCLIGPFTCAKFIELCLVSCDDRNKR